MSSGETPGSVRGFTLIELLVVIAIIAILAGILFPVVGNAMKRAEISRAKAEMAGIVSAIKAFYSEYGIMPSLDTNGSGDYTFAGKWGGAPFSTDNPKRQYTVMDILRAVNTTNNPKRIVFLEVPESSMTGTDLLGNNYQPTDGYYLDPWGNPYCIVMDTEFDGQIGGFADSMTINGRFPAIKDYLLYLSPNRSSAFPGVIAGVMSYGANPGDTNSFLVSW